MGNVNWRPSNWEQIKNIIVELANEPKMAKIVTNIMEYTATKILKEYMASEEFAKDTCEFCREMMARTELTVAMQMAEEKCK